MLRECKLTNSAKSKKVLNAEINLLFTICPLPTATSLPLLTFNHRNIMNINRKAMTTDILYLLIRAALTASLSDRETFIQRVAHVIEQHTHKDPETAKYISDQVAKAMEGLNDTLLIQQLFMPKRDKKLNKTLDQLTLAVEKLNTLLEEAGLSENPAKPDIQ